MSELVRCNICELELSAAEVAKHDESVEHKDRKRRLQNELISISQKKYENDTSVISGWKED